MAISKSTPYVRYKKDFTSSLHLGTIHIESEYLDRTQKTTIESIHGMTWHNKVVNENKELNLLSDTQLELTELEKQYWNTGEKRVSVDEIHTLEEVEPNEDGTYTYTVNSMEGEYIEIYDGINNITSTSDGLDGQFEIVYDTTEEDINGNIALDQVVSQYEITDSGVGAIIGAKSTGLTLVNHITESSKEKVSAIQEYEGQCFTIENTVEGNIKSAILKGSTLVNLIRTIGKTNLGQYQDAVTLTQVKPSTKYLLKIKNNTSEAKSFYSSEITEWTQIDIEANQTITKTLTTKSTLGRNTLLQNLKTHTTEHDLSIIFIEYQEGMENWDIPYFEGMKSVQMPVLTTTGKNLFDSKDFCEKLRLTHLEGGFLCDKATGKYPFKTNGRTCMTVKHKGDSNASGGKSMMQINYTDGTTVHTSLANLKYVFPKPIESIQVNSWQQGTVEVTEIMWYEVNEGEQFS